MIVKTLTPQMWIALKDRCLLFFKNHGDRRITHSALAWLDKIEPQHINESGTSIMVAIIDKRLVGCIACSNFGLNHAIIAIDPRNRKQNIGGTLLRKMIEVLGKLYVTIASDNVPSLTLCFSNNMTAFHLFKGPTGKPTLWLGGGNWSKKDVIQE